MPMKKQAPYSQIERGTLLIATPEITQGIFARAVILICEHSIGGSFGLILNKRIQIELPDELLGQKTIVNPHLFIHAGGPMQVNQLMLLHTSRTILDQTLQIMPGVFLGGNLSFLQSIASQEEGPETRLCFGYTSWEPGHLEREFLDGAWFIIKGTPEDIFSETPETLWRDLLKKMGGKYATLSMIPDELSLN